MKHTAPRGVWGTSTGIVQGNLCVYFVISGGGGGGGGGDPDYVPDLFSEP